jgi:hypothetical protein
MLENLKGRYNKRIDMNKTLHVKRQFAFSTPQSGIAHSESFRRKNMRNTSPRIHRTMFESAKSNEKHTKNIKWSYLTTTLGDETKSQRKKNLKKKLELFGFNDKAVNKLIRKNLNNKAKTKRFRSTGTKGFRDNTPKVTNLTINKRNINYILKKQIQIIGRKKQDIQIDINDIH